jgi:hypothetical protein
MSTSSLWVAWLAVSLVTVTGSSAAQRGENPGAVYATFEMSGATTQLIGLAVGDLLPGAKVILNCSGTSCPFSSKTMNIDSNVKILALTDLFVDPTFKPGTRLEIRVIRPKATGKVYVYETQSSSEPKAKILCLPPGSSQPVECGSG